jgi:hypothetical protein
VKELAAKTMVVELFVRGWAIGILVGASIVVLLVESVDAFVGKWVGGLVGLSLGRSGIDSRIKCVTAGGPVGLGIGFGVGSGVLGVTLGSLSTKS